MRWMISYKYRTNGAEYETVQIVSGSPVQFIKEVNDIEGYEVLCVYSAVPVPKGFRNTNIDDEQFE